MVIVALDFVELSHEHGLKYLCHIEDFKKMVAEAGGHVGGVFLTEAGGSDEVLFISRWAGVESRSKALETIKKSHLKDFLQVGKSIAHHKNFLCFRNPEVPCPPHKGEHGEIVVRMLHVDGNPMAVAKKLAQLHAHLKTKGMDAELIGLLHPIAFTGPVNMICLFEVGPSGIDANLEAFLKILHDPAEAQTAKQVHAFTVVSSRVCKPFNMAKFREAVKAAGVCSGCD